MPTRPAQSPKIIPQAATNKRTDTPRGQCRGSVNLVCRFVPCYNDHDTGSGSKALLRKILPERSGCTIKKRIFAILCILTLCAALLLPSAAADDVCFTAINDTVLPLAADSMPVWSGGVLYVPHSVFDSSSTGVSLGTSCIYNKRSNTVSVFSLSKMVLFDLSSNTCIDQGTGKRVSAKAIMRNGRAYLPVSTVCSLFDLLTPGYVSTEYGYLVRIKNNSAVLTDSQFIDAADNTLSRRLKEYQQSLIVPESKPPVSITVPPETSPIPTPSTPPDTSSQNPSLPTYLAFRCTDPEYASVIADILENNHKAGLFFFRPQDLASQGALIRRLSGSGHSIGILAEGSDITETLALLEEGTEVLQAISHTRTYFALVPKSHRTQAAELGWACWNSSKTYTPDNSVSGYTHALNIIRSLPGSGRIYLTLDSSQYTAGCLSALFQQLEIKNYILSVPRETRL